MSNSSPITNEIKQQLASISNALIKVHKQIELAHNIHAETYTAAVLYNVQDACDSAEVINQNAYDLSGAFAKLRQKVITMTMKRFDEGEAEAREKRIYEEILAAERGSDSDSGGWHACTCDCNRCMRSDKFSKDTIVYEKDGATIKIDFRYDLIDVVGDIPKEVRDKLWLEAQDKYKSMKTSMTKELPPTTPTRRIKPTVCPPAPKKKSKWRAGNRYSALASSSNEPYSTMGSSSRSKSPPSPPQDRRRGGRPCTPGCCAPPTPQVSAFSPPPVDWGEYDPVPDAIDLNDYDMWGRKIHYDLF